ncbi:MAG TPA: MBL fold metallo-hydrolase, partial [Actinopolymorphaceae bacterium]|nr:MBL fold metallo-hydrolase [Actinopolymorphaceae bacterium]
HDDHSGGVRRFAELAGCPVRAFDPAYRTPAGGAARGPDGPDGPDRTARSSAESEAVGTPDREALGLGDGEVVAAGAVELRVVATPGHTADSVSFLVPAEGALLTGDTVLGRGTTVVAHPDGALAPYLSSLRRLRTFVGEASVARLLPGHGPVVDDPAGVLDFYLAHRAERLDQVRQAVAAGAGTAAEVVERVYADVDPVLWPAAELSVRAQLDYLNGRGW